MKNKMTAAVLMVLCVLFSAACAAEGIARSDLFAAGEGGYKSYRIPAMIVSARGTVLAFAEARKNGPADQGDIDIVVRRSFDGGATWDEKRIVYEDGAHTIGNPSPVVDRDTKEIILLFNKDNERVLVTRSVDDGATWAEPEDITKDVKPEGWKWYAMGPGHSIQLRSGRILVPCDHTEKNVGRTHVIYSDDHGRTWRLGGTLPRETDEATAVELVNGDVMINMRNNYMRGKRAVSVSKDGGMTWSKLIFQKELVEPVCEGSILRYTRAGEQDANRLLFSNPASRLREKMTVKMSYDEGRTWPVARLVNEGLSGYSDLAVLPDMSVGLLFENGEKAYHEKITFVKFGLDWLTEGKD
ncbi:MAG TPA: sialidase family protein [bacterium]|nr:sialidase family protein [bacterium]